MANTAIFLTGATGSAGSYVVEELLRRGTNVTALVRRRVKIPGCRIVVGELEGIRRFAREIAEADGIVHLASPRSFDRDSVLTTDIVGSGQLIDLWRKGPFVYVSSTTVHGVPREPLNEASPIDVTDWYDMGKYCNEMQLALARGSGARGHGIALRPALIFSTNGRRYDHHIIGGLFSRCKRIHTAVFESEEALETAGGSYIGGTDFGRAVADALTMTVSGPFTLAGDFQTWRHWIETINKYAGTKVKFVVRPGAQVQPGEWKPPHSRTYLDYSAFKAQTGFEPRQSLDELVQEFVERDRAEKVL